MATPGTNTHFEGGVEPLVLLIPHNAADRDSEWLGVWEREIANCHRIDLGLWDHPHRNTWVNKINLAVHLAARPIILVGHGLGCVAAAWWAEFEKPGFGDPVIAALLVAPPDVDRPGSDARLARFSSCPRRELPFPSMVVAAPHAPPTTYAAQRRLAQDWGSHFIASEDLTPSGDWLGGRQLLEGWALRQADVVSGLHDPRQPRSEQHELGRLPLVR